MKKYQKDFPSWCGECQREKRERQSQCVKATKMVCLNIYIAYKFLSQCPLLPVLRHLFFVLRRLFSGVLEAQRFSLYVGHLCQFGGILNFVHHSGFREVTIVINSQLSARALIDVIAGVCKCKSYQIQPKEM